MGSDLVMDTSKKEELIQKCLLTVQSQQKSYADCHAPNPCPTRLADPNRFPGRET